MGIKLLLDTHALVWWWTDDARLPLHARTAIADPNNTIHVSAASAWEIPTKHRIGQWPEVARLIAAYHMLLRRSRFQALPISMEHAHHAGGLPGPHRDPFDRMLIAQATLDSLPIITADAVFATYGAAVIWDNETSRSR